MRIKTATDIGIIVTHRTNSWNIGSVHNPGQKSEFEKHFTKHCPIFMGSLNFFYAGPSHPKIALPPHLSPPTILSRSPSQAAVGPRSSPGDVRDLATHFHLPSGGCGGLHNQSNPPQVLCGQFSPNSQSLFSLISSLWQEKNAAPPWK